MNISQKTIDNALRSASGSTQGARVVLVINSPLHREMMAEGLASVRGNLTRKGSIAAQRLKREEEDRLFAL